MNLTPHQSEQLRRATSGPIGILGGGPGTGKTFCVSCLCRKLAKTVGSDQIAIAAPTGKAAVRVTEVLQASGLQLRARTWHSLLQGGVEYGFKFDTKNPLPYQVLISDESSMIDTDLMAAILRARAAGTLILLVGDVHQLPPVGHGAPLRDLIAAGLPYGELTEIKRNSGGIVEACHAIRKDEPWVCGDNLHLVDVGDPDEQIAWMLRTINQQDCDRINDIQVVAAVNAKSPLSRKALNQILQRELNAGGESAAGNPYRVGDKIVNTKNGKFPAAEFNLIEDKYDVDMDDKGEVYVANGELARVLIVEPSLTVARLENPTRVVKIPRGSSQADNGESDNENKDSDKTGTGFSWDLGYCLSVHKSQGSEWPVVITMLDSYPGVQRVCSREWLYTAISRAKQRGYLIGRKATADAMCRRPAIWRRKTFLRELILVEKAKAELVEL